MNRCITNQLFSQGHKLLLTLPPHTLATKPRPIAHTLWTSACSCTARHPATPLSHLRRCSARLTTPTPHAWRLFLTKGTSSGTLLPHLRLRLPRPSDRAMSRCGLALAASWFTLLTVQSECDQVDFDLLVKNKILEQDQEQTGWERLAAMYTLDEMGGLTPELELVASIATAGLLIGGTLGAMMNGRLAMIKFVERNQATPFESPIVAKRALQDRVTLGMARGFFMFGWRTALFTSAFTLVSTTLMVYTNQISALHYACGGLVAGALYKANMGLRGMAAGATAGGLLGLIGGGVFSLTCYLTDTTLPQLRYQQYLWKHQQQLRDKARAERKREKRRLEAEKKLKEQQEQAQTLTQSQLQAAAVTSVPSSGSSTVRAADRESCGSSAEPDGDGREGTEAAGGVLDGLDGSEGQDGGVVDERKTGEAS